MGNSALRVLLVTGRLAESALRDMLVDLPQALPSPTDDTATRPVQYDIRVLGISVAALMHTGWVAKKLQLNQAYDRVILPGWCQGDLHVLSSCVGSPCERGPKDLRDLPAYLSGKMGTCPALDSWSIDIIAEINHAPRLSAGELLGQAQRYRESGADVIDLGCIPGERWNSVGAAVRRLRDDGFRISIDSFDEFEVTTAVEHGAELVLSCNGTNRQWACQLPVEWIAIPDQPGDWTSLEETVECLRNAGRSFRIDPILEPIGFGFAASLARYAEARKRWPNDALMMGIGNVTELSEADTNGMNLLLAAICEEWRVGSVLTTEVIHWAQSAVAEFDYARRLVHHAVSQRVLPKHRGSALVMLRGPAPRPRGPAQLEQLAAEIRDANFRLFAEAGEIHIMNRDGYWHGSDPYLVFDEVLAATRDLDSSHAFYLGYEFAKAMTALTLGKHYQQDQALEWGLLTIDETSVVDRRKAKS